MKALRKIYLYCLKKRIESNKNTKVNTNFIPISVLRNIGCNCVLESDVRIYKEDVSIGDYTYINGGKIFYAKIGKFCSIGHDVYLGSGEHYTNKVSTFPLKNKVANISGIVDFPKQNCCIIGNDVWIGNNVSIKQGVKIGDGAIIASGAVVTKDVLPYTIVGGVPAKTIRTRFSDDIIDKLLKIEWWNWDSKKLKQSILNNEFDNVEKFVNRY